MFCSLSSAMAFLAFAQLSGVLAAPTSMLLTRQAACAAYPPGGGPSVHSPNDTVQSFYAYPPFQIAALTAPIPFGYAPVSQFRNLQAAATTTAYLGLNASLTSYNVNACAAQCNSINGCESFNIYYERDPTVNADNTLCPNPPSLTRIKCTFWGVPLYVQNATNTGQYQAQFQVVIAGSDAYNNIVAVAQGPAGPAALAGAPDPALSIFGGVPTFPSLYNPAG